MTALTGLTGLTADAAAGPTRKRRQFDRPALTVSGTAP